DLGQETRDLSLEAKFDNKSLTDLILKAGLLNAAIVYGYDVSKYDNLVIAGRLSIYHLKLGLPRDMTSYAEVMRDKLSFVCHDYIVANAERLDREISERWVSDYDYDWFSAQTNIHLYLQKP